MQTPGFAIQIIMYTLAENSPCTGTDQNGENMGTLEVDCLPVGIEDGFESLNDFAQLQNYPNPFSSVTTISYQLPKASHVTLTIYNHNGQLVETLVNDFRLSGIHSVKWDAESCNNGMYYCKLKSLYQTFRIKILLMK